MVGRNDYGGMVGICVYGGMVGRNDNRGLVGMNGYGGMVGRNVYGEWL